MPGREGIQKSVISLRQEVNAAAAPPLPCFVSVWPFLSCRID